MDFRSDLDVRADDNVRKELQPYVLTQYSGSPTITQLLSDFRANIDPQADIETFKRNIMYIDSANGYGLDVWGRIVGIGRTLAFDDTPITLNDSIYRKLIMHKAMANITNCSLATLNKSLNTLFGENLFSVRNYIVEAQNGTEKYNSYPMHVRFTASRPLTDTEKMLFVLGVTLNLSAGVGWSLFVIQENIFGFAGSGLLPFNVGTFTNGDSISEGGN